MTLTYHGNAQLLRLLLTMQANQLHGGGRVVAASIDKIRILLLLGAMVYSRCQCQLYYIHVESSFIIFSVVS
jgi:hypothetical protein